MAVQSQESTLDQLFESVDLLNKEGLYDAADFVKRHIEVIMVRNIWGFHPELDRQGDRQ